MLKEQTSLCSNEKYVSYDVRSLFINIHVDETISYIINEIYRKKKLPKIFKRLSTTEVSFQSNYIQSIETNQCL